MIILLPIIIVLLVFVSIVLYMPTSVHHEMTRENSTTWGWGSYNAFVREFKKHQWEYDKHYQSWFDSDTDSKIHASIYQFDDKGMCLHLVDYWRVRAFLRRQKLAPKEPRVKWL